MLCRHHEQGRLVVADRVLAVDEFWLAFCAADLIAVPYPAHIGSSGILARAAYARKPVLASVFGWVGYATSTLGLGTTCDVEDPAVFRDELVSALNKADSYAPSEAAETFARFNTTENFQAAWTRRIRQRLGIQFPGPLAGEYQSWPAGA